VVQEFVQAHGGTIELVDGEFPGRIQGAVAEAAGSPTLSALIGNVRMCRCDQMQ